MEWTIERVRELPEDNWLGIRRVGPHAWCIGGKDMMLHTGDGGVLEYLKAFDEECKKPIEPGLYNQLDKDTYSELSYSKLKEAIATALFKTEDGMA